MQKRYKGVTLIELLVVIVIAGIAFSAAVPAFNGMMARNRIATQTNDLLVAINLARSEALRVGDIVSIQSIDDSDGDNEFGPGFCVVLGNPGDCDGTDDPFDPNSADPEPIRRFPAALAEITIDSVDDVGSLQFNSLGGLSGTSSATRRLDICHAEEDSRRIVIALIGRSKSHGPDDPVTANQPEC